MADISVNINTNKLQAQLKVIAKHTQALAEELEQIETEACPDCGTPGEKIKVIADDVAVAEHYECLNCGCKYFDKEND